MKLTDLLALLHDLPLQTEIYIEVNDEVADGNFKIDPVYGAPEDGIVGYIVAPVVEAVQGEPIQMELPFDKEK